MRTLRARLEEKIQQKHMLAHSFYADWQAGKLSKEALQGYVKEYYPFEREFPRFLSAIHSRTESPEMRQLILENLVHEEQGENNHRELWLQFAEGLGVNRTDVEKHFHSDESEHLCRVMRDASADPIEGLAALYAYERQQPDVARTKIDGLKCFYGINDERSLAFFKAHQTYDVYHADTEAELLSKLCDTPEKEERALNAAQKSLDALYDFLDGVERRYCKMN